MGHFVQLSEVSGQRIPLGRREHVADVAKELHDAFGCLVGELQMGLACSFKSSAVYGRLCQPLDSLSVCSLKLRVQREEIADCLLYEGPDFGFLRISSVDLHVKMLEDVVDVSGYVRRAFRTMHHHAVMPAIRAHRGGHGAHAADEGSTGKKREDRLPVEHSTKYRAR
jgi:hypothetical protein